MWDVVPPEVELVPNPLLAEHPRERLRRLERSGRVLPLALAADEQQRGTGPQPVEVVAVQVRDVVDGVREARRVSPLAPHVPTVITCGTAEENLANNRALAEALGERGWPVTTFWNRDAHNWTAWRDALQPQFAELLLRVWT